MSNLKDIQNQRIDERKCIVSNDICEAWGRTGAGGRKENQDCYGGTAIDDAVLLTVCDGMGGMAGGQTASHIAVAEIMKTLKKQAKGGIDEAAVTAAVTAANAAIYQRAYEEPALRGMGTTATVLVLTPQCAYLTHIGDSRIYQLRKGKKIFRTFDHSKVFDMVGQGLMTEEQARQSSFSNIITRALGIRNTTEVTVEKLPYRKGDRFILCCDGIWNIKPEKEMIAFFNEKDKAEDEVQFLTDTVNEAGWDEGGDHDNLTAIVADMKRDSEYQYSCMKMAKDALMKRTRQMRKTFLKYKKH